MKEIKPYKGIPDNILKDMSDKQILEAWNIMQNMNLISSTTQYSPQTSPEREVIDTDYEEVKPKELTNEK